jgi:ATP-binding cassette, subfamily B, bacterial MsbA
MDPTDLSRLATLFLRFARPYWRSLTGIALLTSAVGLVSAVQPLVLAPIVSTALPSQAHAATSWRELTLDNLGPSLQALLGIQSSASAGRVLMAVTALYLLVVSLGAAMKFASTHLVRRIRTTIAADIQSALYQHVLSLSMPFFNARRSGELASRFHWDVIRTAECFDPVVRAFLESGLQLALYGVVLARTDARLAVTVAVLALAHVAITRLLQSEIRTRTADSLEGFAAVSAQANEVFGGIRVVKSFCSETLEHRRLLETLARVKRSTIRFSRYAAAEAPLREVANATIVVVALLVSFRALSSGRLTLPGFVLFVVLARQCLVPISQMSSAVLQLSLMAGASKHITAILESQPVLADGQQEAGRLQTAIRMDRVTFAYGSSLPPALREVSLEIPRGRVLAVVGPSGAGKSTLADLVLRLYDPDSGRILYDGADIRGFRQASYRRRFGVVSQEPLLFNASLEQNIAYGRAVEPEAVERAARVANAIEFIARLPEGFRTEIGDRGLRLSGGQRQRVALARAVYAQPDILLLDEATSSLDSESERLVQRGIEQVLEGSTALVIAHRLSTVTRAHAIVLLNAGRVEAVGPHLELLDTSQLYRRLYDAQFADVSGQL